MQPPPPLPNTPPPPGAIPVEQLHNGLRGQLQKDEHVLWQGRGSGRALNAFNPALGMRLGLLALGAGLLRLPAARQSQPGLQLGRLGARRPAARTRRLVRLAELRHALAPGRHADHPARRLGRPAAPDHELDRSCPAAKAAPTASMSPPHPIIVTGTKERGHIRLNRAPQNTSRLSALHPVQRRAPARSRRPHQAHAEDRPADRGPDEVTTSADMWTRHLRPGETHRLERQHIRRPPARHAPPPRHRRA